MKFNKQNNFRPGRSSGKTYDINGKDIFFRSVWEANYALYLDFLIVHGEIRSWRYEPVTFWFEGIKRGTRSYKPDFEVLLFDDTKEYHEVKGWLDPKSKTKLNRMRIYYPGTKMVLIDRKSYREIVKKLKGIIKFYE